MSEDHSSSRGTEPAFSGARAEGGAHTPGPWFVEETGEVGFGAPVIACGPGAHVAWLTRGLPGSGWPDARLISAAPDLLEALRRAIVELQAVQDGSTNGVPNSMCALIPEVLAGAKAAIAKALSPSTASPAQ